MGNALTGSYEAVVQVSLRQINGLLAALHQNGASEHAKLKLLHSVRMRVGAGPRRHPEADPFRDWVLEYQRRDTPRGFSKLRDEVVGKAPPGLARRLATAFENVAVLPPPEPPTARARGRAEVQLSTLSVSIPPGSSSQVSIHAHVRARFVSDPGTPDLPAPIHGHVRAVFEVTPIIVGTTRRLRIRPSSNDADIAFTAAPGSNLSPSAVAQLSNEVRALVREGFTIMPVAVPPQFPFAEFKGVGAAVALPVSLSGTPLPPNQIHSITQDVLSGSGFGFAVSREHVTSLVDVEAIRDSVRQTSVKVPVFWTPWSGTVYATYRLEFSSGPTLTFVNGGIDISGRIEAKHDFYPNGWVSFRQRVTLRLDSFTGHVTLEAVGEPSVNDSWIVPHDRAVAAVKLEMNKALAANRPAIRKVFADARTNLVAGLQLADSFADAGYTAVDVTPDGIITRGEIVGSGRLSPIVRFTAHPGGATLSAFESWLPAGDISRFKWSWVEYANASIWSGTLRTAVQEHEFTLPRPAGIVGLSEVCLRIEGTQTVPSGLQPGVSGGKVCVVPRPNEVVEAPSWFEPMTVPMWRPDIDAGAVMSDAMAAHLSVQTDEPVDAMGGTNALVAFVSSFSDPTIGAIATALGKCRPRGRAVVVMLVAPRGALQLRRRELDARLEPLMRAGMLAVHVTEDDEGGWTRTFAPDQVPAAYLINARRETAWKHMGELSPDVLTEALDEHVLPAPGLQPKPLALTVAVGERAPDVAFSDAGEYASMLHRQKGRRVLLNFWQPWSAPCLQELQRLQRVFDAGKGSTLVVAFHGGQDPSHMEEVRKRLELRFPVVHDAQQRAGRKYGIRCWPTTVTISAEGLIEDVDYGIAHSSEHDMR